jgi:hypothetical protein
MCALAETDHPYYNKASYEFFSHIRELVESTIIYLERLPKRTHRFQDIEYSIRQKLRVLRHSWGRIHRYIRPSLDADTLHIPLPLLDAFNDNVQDIGGCEEFRFALFHTTEHNYLMLTNEEVGKFVGYVAACVGGKPFPRHLGLVGIPYSQASGLILNCLIPHEMAHFVYQERTMEQIRERVDSILTKYYPEEPGIPAESLARIGFIVNSWVEEAFCDLFAISIIGPSFTFASAEFTSASLIVNAPGDYPEHFQFGWEHPAMVARFYLQQKHLEALGWWKHVEAWKSSPIELLKFCKKQKSQTTIPDAILEHVGATLELQCFWDACEWLLPFMRETLPKPDIAVKNFEDISGTISNYLANAIVPSTVIVDSNAVHPSPVVLINSTFRFLLEEFERLLENIEKVSADSISDRSKYTERIELWILKAIEDYRLLTDQRETE